MALKSYEELVKVDVRQYCEERDGFTYLNWAKCIELLRQNGATEVYWEPIPDPQTGSSLRKTDIEFKDKNNNTNRCYETRIKVVIDDKEYEMQTPVMNGANPVKDNSMSQQRVWNSMCRAFVKCVAIHTGLGFNLWLKEEYNKLEDVVGLPGIHIECKRVEKLNIYDAVEQSKNDARTGEMPVVMHRKNRKEWLVTMPLDDWMKLYEKMVEEVQNA